MGACRVYFTLSRRLMNLWLCARSASIWLVVPSMVIYVLGKDIVDAFYVADRAAKKETSGKRL